MKKQLPVNRLLAICCLSLLIGLPFGCSEFNQILKDHPCCVSEKKAADDARNIYITASNREAPSGAALITAQLELTRLNNILEDCKATAPKPVFDCQKQSTAAHNQQTVVNDLTTINTPLLRAKEAAKAAKDKADDALDACAKKNNCTP